MLYYEDGLMNKIIATVTLPFENFDENSVRSFNNICELTFHPLERVTDEDEIYIMFHSRVKQELIDKLIDQSMTRLTFIIKDNEYESEDASYINWNIMWSDARRNLEHLHVEPEIMEIIFNYYKSVPTLRQRRIVEYLNGYLSQTKTKFLEVLLNEKHINLFESHGISKLQTNKKNVDDSIARSSKRMINKDMYYVSVSNNLEVAFEILKRQIDVKSCLLLELDLKQSLLHIKEVSLIDPLFPWDMKCGPYSVKTVPLKEISSFI
jgi:hypothetical protein